MGKKTVKRALKGASILFFLVLSLVALGQVVYPDRISRFAGEDVESKLCFSLKTEAEEEDGAEKGRILAFGILPVKEVRVESFERMDLIPGGELFGIRMEIDGLLVSGTGPVEGTEKSPATEAGIQPGDRLLRVDGVALRGAASFTKLLAKCGGSAMTVTLERNGRETDVTLTPVRDPAGVWRAGLWVREAAAGIGTVTFIDPRTGSFAGLGHGICDAESGALLPLRGGSVCKVKPEGAKRGTPAQPGEVRGTLTDETIGELRANTPTGIYGTAKDAQSRADGEAVPVALKDEVKPGKVTILCQIDESGKKAYDARIEEICDPNSQTKNFVIRVTDPELLEKTGGIIQGMSGSPILQNGKLIGAVTHVMVRSPEEGYGIFLENMLKSDGMRESAPKAA